MSDGLDKQQKNHRCQCCGIVRHGPDQNQEPGCAYQKDQERQTHLAIEKNERETRQEQESTPPEIGATSARQLFGGNLENVRPSVLIVFALPPIVEILELLIVILNGLLGAVPQEQSRGSIGPGVQGIWEEEGV